MRTRHGARLDWEWDAWDARRASDLLSVALRHNSVLCPLIPRMPALDTQAGARKPRPKVVAAHSDKHPNAPGKPGTWSG
jgi:hypothetical protein